MIAPDNLVELSEVFDRLGRRLFEREWDPSDISRHLAAAHPGQGGKVRSPEHVRAWQVLHALIFHIRENRIPVSSERAEGGRGRIYGHEVEWVYPMPRPGQPGQIELLTGVMLPAWANVSELETVLRKFHPRRERKGRPIKYIECRQTVRRYWQANRNKVPPGQVIAYLREVDRSLVDPVPPATLYRIIDAERIEVWQPF